MDKPIQLRDGGRYRTKGGNIIKAHILREGGGWFICTDGHYRDPEGYISVFHYDHVLNIVAEYTEVTDEKEEENVDWTIEVGKFYECSEHQKWECLHIHGNIAFMAAAMNHHGMVYMGDKVFLHVHSEIIGPWNEPLAIQWDWINPYTDRIEIAERRLVLLGGEEQYGFLSVSQADHTAPGWMEHVGEIHYRDGRVERSEA